MFSSVILDVAIGLIFCFLTVSLVASAVLEALSSVMTWRSKDLRQGIQQMVNDPGFTGLALDLYQHAAINPRGSLTGAALAQNKNAVDLARPPAYIASAQFAAALMDILGLSTAAQPTAALQASVDAKLQVANPQIHALVSGIVQRADGDLTIMKTELAAWFDNAMNRLSGAYKRKTQLVSFLVALILSATLNIDSIRVAHELWNHPALAEGLKLPPEVAPPAPNDGSAAPVTGTKAGANTNAQAGARMIQILDQHLPIGWQTDTSPAHDAWYWFAMLFGWLITAVAALFGAPFWFDTLQSIVRLKGAGPSPAEKLERRAASA